MTHDGREFEFIGRKLSAGSFAIMDVDVVAWTDTECVMERGLEITGAPITNQLLSRVRQPQYARECSVRKAFYLFWKELSCEKLSFAISHEVFIELPQQSAPRMALRIELSPVSADRVSAP